MARCPAHDDRTPSLGVTLGRRAILFHCFAGCSQDQVLTALAGRGVSPASMFSGQVEINAGDGARKLAHHAFAERICRGAAPIGDTLAKAYLEGRGIRAVSRALRFQYGRRVVEGQRVYVRIELGGRRILTKKIIEKITIKTNT